MQIKDTFTPDKMLNGLRETGTIDGQDSKMVQEIVTTQSPTTS